MPNPTKNRVSQVRITRFHDSKREIQYSFGEISGYMPEGVGISLHSLVYQYQH